MTPSSGDRALVGLLMGAFVAFLLHVWVVWLPIVVILTVMVMVRIERKRSKS